MSAPSRPPGLPLPPVGTGRPLSQDGTQSHPRPPFTDNGKRVGGNDAWDFTKAPQTKGKSRGPLQRCCSLSENPDAGIIGSAAIKGSIPLGTQRKSASNVRSDFGFVSNSAPYQVQQPPVQQPNNERTTGASPARKTMPTPTRAGVPQVNSGFPATANANRGFPATTQTNNENSASAQASGAPRPSTSNSGPKPSNLTDNASQQVDPTSGFWLALVGGSQTNTREIDFPICYDPVTRALTVFNVRCDSYVRTDIRRLPFLAGMLALASYQGASWIFQAAGRRMSQPNSWKIQVNAYPGIDNQRRAATTYAFSGCSPLVALNEALRQKLFESIYTDRSLGPALCTQGTGYLTDQYRNRLLEAKTLRPANIVYQVCSGRYYLVEGRWYTWNSVERCLETA